MRVATDLPHNWKTETNTNDSQKYGYRYFYDNLFVNKGIGVTGTTWAQKPAEGIYFVTGDLNIDSSLTALLPGKTLLTIVNGDITIDKAVDTVAGMFVANGNINIGESSADQLVINGSLYALGNINFSRDLSNAEIGNTTPAVVVNYDPNLLLNLPGAVMQVLSGWKEE